MLGHDGEFNLAFLNVENRVSRVPLSEGWLRLGRTCFPSPTVARNFFGSKSPFLVDTMCRERCGTLFLGDLNYTPCQLPGGLERLFYTYVRWRTQTLASQTGAEKESWVSHYIGIPKPGVRISPIRVVVAEEFLPFRQYICMTLAKLPEVQVICEPMD
jgi:hypothetical protein